METSSPKSHCSSCTLCCKVLGIRELAKAPAAWCSHCDKGRGCRIYGTRPPTCAEFACTWLQARTEGTPIDDALKPDRCHIVFHEYEGEPRIVMAHVDPAYPDAWRSGAGMRLIADMAATGTVVCVVTGRHNLIVDGTGIYQGTSVGPRADGAEQFVKGRQIGRLATAPGRRVS